MKSLNGKNIYSEREFHVLRLILKERKKKKKEKNNRQKYRRAFKQNKTKQNKK